jgi:hypothetical protein
VLVSKAKEKAAVAKAALDALDAMARHSFGLPDVADDIVAGLGHQHPKVKEGTIAWLTGCMPRETKAGVLKLLPAVVPAAAKCTEDGAPAIREAATALLVQMALRVRLVVCGHARLCCRADGLANETDSARERLCLCCVLAHCSLLAACPGWQPGAAGQGPFLHG